MSRQCGILWICIICCFTSCVSKKKYVALEAAHNHLETANIRQYKTIDTLQAELRHQTDAADRLKQDTSRLRSLLRENRKELDKVQTYLSSSKKELNERIRELQQRDTAIQHCQRLTQSYADSMSILRKEADFLLELLTEDDSSFREVILTPRQNEVVIEVPEHFFFTPNNRNFISGKGKEMLKLLSEIYQKYPSVYFEIVAPVRSETALSTLKETMERESVRTAAICRSMLTDHQVSSRHIRSGIRLMDAQSSAYIQHNSIWLCISLDTTPITKAVKNL